MSHHEIIIIIIIAVIKRNCSQLEVLKLMRIQWVKEHTEFDL